MSLLAGGVLALERAHVQAEDVQLGAALDLAVDPRILEAGCPGLERAGVADGLVLLPRATAPLGQGVDIEDRVALVLQGLAGVPVVGGLVVVPLREQGGVRVEVPDVVIHHVVAMAGPELLLGLGHLRHALGHHVAPDLAVGLLVLGLDGAVRVDRVAGVDEEVRVRGRHGPVGAHAAQIRVDAEALPRGVGGPHEGLTGARGPADALAAARAQPLGSGAEGPELRGRADTGLVLELHGVEELRAGGQPGHADLGGVVGLGGDPSGLDGLLEAPAPAGRVEGIVHRGDLDDHAAVAGGARPHDDGVLRGLPRHDARGQVEAAADDTRGRGALAGRGDRGRGRGGGGGDGEDGGGGSGGEQTAAGDGSHGPIIRTPPVCAPTPR